MSAGHASRDAQLHWLALHLIPGLGARNALRLAAIFGRPEAVFHSSLSELAAAVPKLPRAVAQAIHSGVSFEDAADELRKCEGEGIEIVPYQDPRYPQRLKEIYDPPLLLYAKGRTELLGSHCVAVVGTRHPTPYGRAVAEKLCRELALAGLTLVSGMARGVDAWAHRGALEANGATIAVLGTGVDKPYPSENRKLYEQIANQGLVISEFRLGTTPFAQNFPIRNRIVSGTSLGVLVVEGAQYSGSLITARLALEQGRDVMAVPGNIVSKQSWGPNLLIKDGAKLIQDASDVIEELPIDVRQEIGARRQASSTERIGAREGAALDGASPGPAAGSPAARAVLAMLRVDESVHIDDLIRGGQGLDASGVLAALSELELLGAIKQLPGKRFVLAWG